MYHTYSRRAEGGWQRKNAKRSQDSESGGCLFATQSGDREECGRYWFAFNILNIFVFDSLDLFVCGSFTDELMSLSFLGEQKVVWYKCRVYRALIKMDCPVEATVGLAGFCVPTSLECPAPVLSLYNNGFIFHHGAKTAPAQTLHHCHMWRSQETRWHRGWTDKPAVLRSRLISTYFG